jgi:hypothetical protein
MNEAQLAKLKAGAEKTQTTINGLQTVANAAKAGFTDPQGNRYVLNEQTGKWEPQAKAPEPKTDDSRLTPEEREDLAFARNERLRQKTELVDRLVANVAEPHRAAQRERLMKRGLDDLRADVSLLPPAPQQPPTYNADNPLGLPTLPPAYATLPPLGQVIGQQPGGQQQTPAQPPVYIGAGTPQVGNQGAEDKDILPLPGPMEYEPVGNRRGSRGRDDQPQRKAN